jgi:hypothetical protein
MEGARALNFRPYWIRYIVAFWAGEKIKWARDNVLIACLCSLAPGLIVAGISAALSDHVLAQREMEKRRSPLV